MSAHDSKNIILTKAALKSGANLGLTNDDIAKITHCSLDILQNESIEPSSYEGQKALILIRIYEALYSLIGNDMANIKHWMNSVIKPLQGRPADLIFKPDGLENVIEYLDTMKSRL